MNILGLGATYSLLLILLPLLLPRFLLLLYLPLPFLLPFKGVKTLLSLRATQTQSADHRLPTLTLI